MLIKMANLRFRCSEKAEKGSKCKKKKKNREKMQHHLFSWHFYSFRFRQWWDGKQFFQTSQSGEHLRRRSGPRLSRRGEMAAEVEQTSFTSFALGMLSVGKCYKFWEHNPIDLLEQNCFWCNCQRLRRSNNELNYYQKIYTYDVCK